MLLDINSSTGRISSGLRNHVHHVRDLSSGRLHQRARRVVVKVAESRDGALRECETDLRLDGRTEVVARGRAPELHAARQRLQRALPAATH